MAEICSDGVAGFKWIEKRVTLLEFGRSFIELVRIYSVV